MYLFYLFFNLFLFLLIYLIIFYLQLNKKKCASTTQCMMCQSALILIAETFLSVPFLYFFETVFHL